MYGALLSPNSTVTFGRTNFEMHAKSGATYLDLNGVLPAATQIEGSDLNLKVRGPNIRQLFDFLGVAAPDTRAYWFTSKLTKVGGEWRFTGINGRYGASDLHGKMTISFPKERLFLDAVLDSNLVDIIDVGPFIGYAPEALATQGVQAAVAQTGGTPRILPDAPLRMEAIRNFDAHILYKVKDFRNPKFPISNVNLTFDLNNSLMKLSPFTFDIAGGHLASDISINARVPAVITDYDIRLSPTPMSKLLAGFGVQQAGTTGTVKARIKMSGTGDTLRDSLATSNGRIAIILPKGTFWTQYIQLSEFDLGRVRAEAAAGQAEEAGRDQLRPAGVHRAQWRRGSRSDPDRHRQECHDGQGRLQLQGRIARHELPCRCEEVQPVLRPVAGSASRAISRRRASTSSARS